MSRVRFGAGVLAASCAIGPLILLAIAGYDIATRGLVGEEQLAGVAAAMIPALLVGAFFSSLPNVIGSALLGWLGMRRRWARHPLVWLATGVVAGGVIGAVVDNGARSGLPLFFGVAGGVSALLCRRGTDWND